MQGFGLLLGHLVGDYVVQNDWMARNKSSRAPSWTGFWACTLHCLLYTLSVWALSFRWMPWWGPPACFLVHWPVDRYRLTRWWMDRVSGQREFAAGPLSPWSVVVVDNTFHLLTLYAIALLSP